MRRILCIGSSGQLARSLSALGEHIIAIGRPDADLLDTDSLFAAIDRIGPDAVINTAAYTAVDQAETDVAMAVAINTEGAGRLAAICRARDVPLIHVSTDYVFDGLKGAPYTEGDATNPVNKYGQTKLDGECAVQDANHDALIIRTAWVHSPYGQNFTRTMMRLLIERDEIGVVDDQFGSPTYAPHLAEGLLACLESKGAAGFRIYHLAGSGYASRIEWVGEIASALRDAGHVPAQIKPVGSAAFPTPAKRPPDTRLDCNLIQQERGIALPEWREGVRACVQALL